VPFLCNSASLGVRVFVLITVHSFSVFLLSWRDFVCSLSPIVTERSALAFHSRFSSLLRDPRLVLPCCAPLRAFVCLFNKHLLLWKSPCACVLDPRCLTKSEEVQVSCKRNILAGMKSTSLVFHSTLYIPNKPTHMLIILYIDIVISNLFSILLGCSSTKVLWRVLARWTMSHYSLCLSSDTFVKYLTNAEKTYYCYDYLGKIFSLSSYFEMNNFSFEIILPE